MTDDAGGAPPGVDQLTLVAFGALVVLIGTNVIAIKFTVLELDPFWGAGVRFAVGSMLFALIMLARRSGIPRGRGLAGAVLYGLLGFAVPFAFGYWGAVDAPAGLAVIVFALVPVSTVLLAIVHGVERFRWAALIGGLVAAAGVAIAYGGVAAQGVPLVSVLAFMVAALAFAETNIVVKRLPPMDPASANTIGTGVAAVILLALSVLFGESRELPERTETWLAVGYLTTLGTLAVFLLFLYVIRRWRASAVAYEFVLSPFVAVTLGVLLLGEQVTPLFLVGGGLVLIGVYLGALAPAAAEPPAGPAPEPKS